MVHPGHDYGDTPTSTIGTEKRQNPFMNLRARPKNSFAASPVAVEVARRCRI